MARYVQSSTENPYGHKPWQTSLYTTFGDFAWLKQPQNAINREPAGIAPRIRKPPELAGMTVVGGSGRILGTLGLDMTAQEAGIWRMAGGRPIAPIRAVAMDSAPIVAPTPVATSAGGVSTYLPGATGPAGSPFAAAAATTPPPAIAAPVPAAAAAPSLVDQVQAWLSGSMFAGIPNYWLALGAGVLLLGSNAKKGRF